MNKEDNNAPTAVLNLLAPEEQVQLSRCTDIKLDGLYGSAWLLATDRRLLAYSPDGGGPPNIVDLPLSEITAVEIEDLHGSGALKARIAKRGAIVALFSKKLGAHDELIAQDGIYAKLVRMQTEMSRIRAV